MEQKTPNPKPSQTDSFDEVYANNSRFEPSVWDLKLIFGQLAQHEAGPGEDWHTAVTVPWIQAKLLSYYLRLNLAYHEHQHGPFNVPSAVSPQLVDPPTEEQLRSDPKLLELYKVHKRIHEEMFG